MQFQCDATARVPIYRQLMDQVRKAVARGRVQPGDRLPSVRQLSRELVVNPNTIAKAYSELEREGVLNTRPGLGAFIAKPQAYLSTKVRKQRLLAALDLCLTETVHLGFTAEEVSTAFTQQMAQYQFKEERIAQEDST
ncbi:MAG: GntR family transcriptional regulator [Pirellulales bacterium]